MLSPRGRRDARRHAGRLARTAIGLAAVAAGACRSAPPAVRFDPDPVTKWRWRGQLAAPTSLPATAATVAAPRPAGTAGPNGTTRASADGEVVPTSAVATGFAGSAVVQPGTHAGETLAFLALGGVPAGSAWRWRVLAGDCATGTAVGPEHAFPLAVASADGLAESAATLAAPAPRSARWAVQVRPAAAGDAAPPAACAPLQLAR